MKRLAQAVPFFIAVLFAIGYLVDRSPESSNHQGLFGGSRKLAVSQTAEQAVFRNELGTFTVEKGCPGLGAGYISRWVNPAGKVISQDKFNPPGNGTSSAQGYLNDPHQGGLFAFSAYTIPYGTPPPFQYWDLVWGPPPRNFSSFASNRRCVFPGIAWVNPPQVTSDSYNQSICLLPKCQVRIRQELDFGVRFVRSRVTATFREGPAFVKEPEIALNFQNAGIGEIRTPGVEKYKGGCIDYTGLADPRLRTGRCEHPDRDSVVLAPEYRLDVSDLSWRSLADKARDWDRAGDDPCPGWTQFRIHDNWEYGVWNLTGGPMDEVTIMLKGWEGCVSGLDFSHGQRRGLGQGSITVTLRALP